MKKTGRKKASRKASAPAAEENEPKRAASPPSAVGSILNAFLKRMGYDVAFKEHEVVENWAAIVGPRIAGMTVCEKSEKGVLSVKVRSAAWRQELTYMKDVIKESIVRETGCETIKDILFH